MRSGFDEECVESLRVRNEYTHAMLQHSTRQNSSKYKESRKKAKKIIRTKKWEYLKMKVKQIEELRTNNETRKFYGAIKYMNRGFQPKIFSCKDKGGKAVERRVKG